VHCFVWEASWPLWPKRYPVYNVPKEQPSLPTLKLAVSHSSLEVAEDGGAEGTRCDWPLCR